MLGLGRCLDQIPSRREIESSINRTIEEVERLVAADSSLPRLSRSQIVEILENITSQDMESYEESVEQMRSNYQRALMVVLPYNSKDLANENLEDLYTKAPMIQLIPDSGTMLPFASIQEESPSSQSTSISNNHNLIDKKRLEDKNKFVTSANEYKNHRSSYSNINLNPVPEKFSFDLNNLNRAKPKHPVTKSPFSKTTTKDDPTTEKSELEIIYSTKVTEEPIKSTTPADIKPTVPSTKSTVNVLTSDQWTYNAPPSPTTSRPTTTTFRTTTTRRTTTTSRPSTTSHPSTTIRPKKLPKIESKNKTFLPTVVTAIAENETIVPFKKSPKVTSQAPEIITFNLAEMEMMNDAPTASFYVTPMSSSTTGKSDSTSFIVPTSSNQEILTSPPMRREVATLLASIGLRPKEEEEIKTRDKLNDLSEEELFGDDFRIPESSNIIPTRVSALTATAIDSPSISSQNTFENDKNNDFKKGMSNLSPEVQLLFQKFGLPISGKKNEITTTTTIKPPPARPQVASNNWNYFRPLPTSEVKDDEMRKFLASFGLGIDNRNRKSMKTVRTTIPSVIEAVPNNMKSILENIGLITRSESSKRADILTTTTEDPSKLHVFKPHKTLLGDQKQKNKINELLDTVKLVQEGKANVSDIRNIANDLMKNTKTLQGGPDPISLEEILQNYNENLRNEVKRQETTENITETTMKDSEMSSTLSNDSNSTTMSSNTSDSSTSDSRAVESGTSESVNFDGLADSFGGTTALPDPELPTPRKSGLYFLVDWNTFLDVGEEDKDRVNLRFAPKVGDKMNFIPVVIP